MIKVDLINYFDVWGNEKDGWEINNLCKDGSFELPVSFTNENIVDELIAIGFFKPSVTVEMVRFEDLSDFGVELYQADNDCPICRIEYYLKD